VETIEHNGNKIEMSPDGKIKVTTAAGQVINLDEQGNAFIDLSSIKAIGFENVVDLKSYVIMREGELTVHRVEFIDGGVVKIAYASDGKLVEFTGKEIGQTITKENEIVIRSSTASKKKNESAFKKR